MLTLVKAKKVLEPKSFNQPADFHLTFDLHQPHELDGQSCPEDSVTSSMKNIPSAKVSDLENGGPGVNTSNGVSQKHLNMDSRKVSEWSFFSYFS